MIYSRGDFQVLLFGEYGNKLYTHETQSYSESTDLADMFISLRPKCSAVINRTVWNSRDSDNKWDYVP